MALSTFGFMTGMMLSTPRTLFALAADGFSRARWRECIRSITRPTLPSRYRE